MVCFLEVHFAGVKFYSEIMAKLIMTCVMSDIRVIMIVTSCDRFCNIGND